MLSFIFYQGEEKRGRGVNKRKRVIETEMRPTGETRENWRENSAYHSGEIIPLGTQRSPGSPSLGEGKNRC